jgi:hypothetical protein
MTVAGEASSAVPAGNESACLLIRYPGFWLKEQMYSSLGTIRGGSHMTIQLDWPPDVVDRLTEEARQKGLSLDTYLLQTVLQHKASDGTANDDSEQRRKRAEARTRILDIQKRVRPDPEGWTSRDYINYGRR